MNHTKNYHLPQWSEDDLILMEDFNKMNKSIEAGMTNTAAAAADAQKTAENARQTAVTAFRPGYLPYVVGSYTGDGTTFRDFNLGFRPSFVLICGDQRTHRMEYAGYGTAMAGPTVNSRRIYLTDTGFRIDSSDTTNIHPYVNEAGKTFDYIAFR